MKTKTQFSKTSGGLRRRISIFFLTAVLALPVWAADHYLAPGHLDAIALLGPPPVPGSEEAAADMQQAREVVKARTSAESAQAKIDMKLTPFTFAQVIGTNFQKVNFPKTSALLDKVRKDIRDPLNTAKQYYKRQRPFQVDATLFFGDPDDGFSYPSGHSTVATADALVLAELFPAHRDAILELGRQVGWDRVLTGYHFLTDVRAGRVLGQAIVREMKTNPDFQHDFAEAKAEVAAAESH